MSEVPIETLNKIFERLGGIDAKLESGKDAHNEFRMGLIGIRAELGTVNQRLGEVEKLAARVTVLEPVLWEHEGARLEAEGVKKFWGGVMTKGRAAVGIVGGSIGAALAAAVTWLVNLFPGHPPH